MTGQETNQAVSAALIEAQTRLMEIRAVRHRSRSDRRIVDATVTVCHFPRIKDQQLVRPAGDDCPDVNLLPAHLGWGSQNLSKALRHSFRSKQHVNEYLKKKSVDLPQRVPNQKPPTLKIEDVGSVVSCPAIDPVVQFSIQDVEMGAVKLHPDIGLGILRKKMAAAGRIWLLLRWIDRSGSGRIEITRVRELLCDSQSSVSVCGWRHMRSILAQGQDVFWNHRDGRIWLKSIPKVAQALGTERLSGLPVSIPVKILTQGIGQVRAHLFASFHSGRRAPTPISRAALAELSQVSPRTQQNYDRRSRVRKLKNFAVGTKISSDDAMDQAWQRRSACFSWNDRKAEYGARNTSYLAWQLPNSYLGPHQQRPAGRQKRFNRELAVLYAKGMTGNDRFMVEFRPKRYFNAANNAALTQSSSQTDVYWRGKHPGLWYFMESLG